MITGQRVGSLLDKLNKSNFQFHLTGSRFFGNEKITSDWDFFCQQTPEVFQELIDMDFRQDDDSSYSTSTLVLACGNVHVQLVSDFEHKVKVQNQIASSPYLLSLIRHSDKQVRKAVWSYLLDQK